MADNKITYSEIFSSFQGEGIYTGKRTMWLRLFSCSLQCQGFGQKDPTDQSTYELTYEDFDVSTVKTLEDLPVWKFACDSSYSWAKKFRHLNRSGTPAEIAEEIMSLLRTVENPLGTFLHDKSGQEAHLCFTGGEPLMPTNQVAIMQILDEFEKFYGGFEPRTKYRLQSNLPSYLTFETNGTQKLKGEFVEYFRTYPGEVLFSVSPKLWTVSGESNKKAICPSIVAQYQNKVSRFGQLKFVLGVEDRQWDELDIVIKQFRDVGVEYPVYIMPVGARVEEQDEVAEAVANRAIASGYEVSGRLHAYIFGNRIGT